MSGCRNLAGAVMVAAAGVGPAGAADLFTTNGAWIGEGSLSTGVERPLQRGRCRVEVTPDATAGDVSVKGTCVVAAGASDISLRVVRDPDGALRAGFWSAATQQTLQLTGADAESGFDLMSAAPLVVEDKSYDAWVIVRAPQADGFTIQQMMRPSGETSWRLVADMTYRRAGS